MDWVGPLLAIFGGLIALMLTGIPVAFAFIGVTLAGVFLLQGGGPPFRQFILSIESSVTSFTLLPIPLFVLMGEVLWHSAIASRAVAAIDKLIGRVPGRLSLVTIASGTVFSALSGSTMANTAVLGNLLLPEMLRRGYSPRMAMGPILSSGALAMLVPPSALAVVYATIAQISVGDLLVALLLPGLMLAVLYVGYIVLAAWLDPRSAPVYEGPRIGLGEALRDIAIHVAPLSIVVFSVVGVIFFGIATPTEAAALGSVASIGMAFAYGDFTFAKFGDAIGGALRITVMMLTILAGAIGFSQILAFSGASRGLIDFVTGLSVEPVAIVFLMLAIVLLLGCFMEQIAIMLITLPIFMPLIKAIGMDPIWFAVLMLINLEMALMTPPFGLLLFVMKGVAPAQTTMRQIYMSAIPFLLINALAIVLIVVFPNIALWIPSLSG